MRNGKREKVIKSKRWGSEWTREEQRQTWGTPAPRVVSNIGRNCAVWIGVGHTRANYRGRGSSNNEFWSQKTRVPGLSRGVVCVILSLAVLIQYRRVTHKYRQTHEDCYYPRIACAAVRVTNSISSFYQPYWWFSVFTPIKLWMTVAANYEFFFWKLKSIILK